MKMDIIIKNVTGKAENNSYISELSRSGFPVGSIIRNVEYLSVNKCCYWTSGIEQCVAYVGETCAVKTIYFKAEIVREYSAIPTPDHLGVADCSMEIFFNDDDTPTCIEWIIEYDDGTTDEENIGLWFENRTLTDFDGLFSLPYHARKLIRLNGFRIPRDF